MGISTRLGLTAASIAMAMAGSPAAFAQAGPVLTVPADRTGELDARDSKTQAGQPYDEYRLALRAGQRLRASAASSDFDTVVEIRAEGAGDSDTPLAQNDDSGEGLNSSLTFSAPADGAYRIRVHTFDGAAKGAYTLKLEAVAPLPPPLRPVATSSGSMQWSTYLGELTGSDPEDAGSRFDDYELAFEKDAEILLRLDSGGFDPVVRIFKSGQRDGPEIASNDDGGGGTDSLLFFTPEDSGNYIVRVGTVGEATTGVYRLRIGR